MSNERLDVDGRRPPSSACRPSASSTTSTLIGDTVDNMPGVDKVGPKTAAKWIAEHGSLEGVIAAAPSIKGVVGENLRKALDWLPQGRRLVTVVTDCDLRGPRRSAGPSSTRWRCATIDVDGAARLLRPLRLRVDASASSRRARAPRRPARARRRRRGDAADASTRRRRCRRETIVKHYETVTTLRRARRLARAHRARAELTALDTETDSLDPMRARLVGLSLAVAPGEAAYVPLAHSYAGAPDQLPLDDGARAAEALARGRGARPRSASNVKYDAPRLRQRTASPCAATRTTRCCESYVLRGAQGAHASRASPTATSAAPALTYEDVCGKGANQIPFAQVEIGARRRVLVRGRRHGAARAPGAAGRASRPSPACADVYRRIEMPTSARARPRSSATAC